ncbi:MAG: bifunctional hydroxymethylpyrimidine kinase/phosphomethylpyrimidine kinase [Muribaculaceae bacterium]|nr:bifunctional hydroxymethylpyrimidine kinase/phosphomethylpyrimidine kinase [Muribaculaceae bacterium]
MRKYFTVLSIAGSDSSGGAGIQADIKTISALGCYAMTAITGLTAQNTTGVTAIEPTSPSMVAAQIDAVYADIPPMAVKTGMLTDLPAATAVAERLEHYRPSNLVVDPVMVSTSGSMLLQPDAIEVIRTRIFPLALIITPNQAEARALTGYEDAESQARILLQMGPKAVLIKGGDTADTDFKTDLLYISGQKPKELRADAIDTPNTHGTGCTLSSAIASYLAMGYGIEDAVRAAKLYISRALEAGAFVTTGRGHGPVNHFFSPRRLKNFNPTRQ